MSSKFNKKDLEFYLPESFKGLSKSYILEKICDKKIQDSWIPKVGDIIVGRTGNIFVISGEHKLVEELGGTVYFFGGGLCSRDGSSFLNDTYSICLNKDGCKYSRTWEGIKKEYDSYYSKISDFRYVPYPHELELPF